MGLGDLGDGFWDLKSGIQGLPRSFYDSVDEIKLPGWNLGL